MSVPDVSVVVPVYNASAYIAGLIRALEDQTLDRARYEVILVDDASTDDTVQTIMSTLKGTEASFALVRQERNRGPAAARNAGLALATAPVIAFTDSDCEPDPDWLERGLERLNSAEAPAGVEGRTLPKGEPGPLTHQMINTTGGLYMTCNMFYRRDALAGGFDERFRLAFLEDSDVAFSVLERGDQIAWDPDVVVRHLVLPASRTKFMREARKRYYNPLLYSKHPEMYRKHIRGVVPGLPRLHLKYMASVTAIPVAAATGYSGIAVFMCAPTALYLRRIWHAYRAKDALTRLQAAWHPWAQTWFVIRGGMRFRALSPKL
jgi:glycosyltransferase involved in cell wall biosynthesis